MHNEDANETHGEKVRWELLKNATYCFEQILEATPYKIVAVWPLISHLTSHPGKMNKICEVLLEKQGQIYKQPCSMDVGQSAKRLTSAPYEHWMSFGRPPTWSNG